MIGSLYLKLIMTIGLQGEWQDGKRFGIDETTKYRVDMGTKNWCHEILLTLLFMDVE